MRIDLKNIDNLVNALRQGRAVESKVEDLSLGAAMELAAWLFDGTSKPVSPHQHFLSNRLFAEAWRLFEGGRTNNPWRPWDAVDEAFFPVRGADSLEGEDWGQVLQRLKSALLRNGFPEGFHKGMASAFADMADNIIQHSVFGTERGLNGIVAYQVRPKEVSFTIADVGIGALQSLTSNPQYSELSSSRKALDLICRNKASRRVNQGAGQGYNDLFVALASYNGLVRVRSGDGVFSIEGEIGRIEPQTASLHPTPGLQLSVECRI
jgi:hypothetical protein